MTSVADQADVAQRLIVLLDPDDSRYALRSGRRSSSWSST
jgi:hypothetical protein